MARLFPARSACRFDTAGERRLAERLEKKLESDYLCWFNVPVGPEALQPDFVLLHPLRGLVVLEVKDWKLETIARMDRGTAKLYVNGRLTSTRNPMMQARAYALEVAIALQQDSALVTPPNTPHAGHLIMPYGWGVVMTRITRKQFETTDLAEVLDPQRVIFQDEMTESVDADTFQKRLWGMLHHVFPCHLTLPQINRVRFHLYPEVRVNVQPGQFGLFTGETATLPDLVKVMDVQQEQLARSLGAGHRVIHGAAGSGKTMILGYRCEYLARTSSKPVLVLCYNKSLAGRLQQVIAARGLGEKVTVHSFHAWCREMLRSYHIDLPDDALQVDEKMQQMVQRTMDGVERSRIPRAQYAAVMIDEGHDFKPDWFRLVVQMVDPDTNALLVLYDDAQSIYRGSEGKDHASFSFASVGIQAQGRTTILRLNYRNTLEVLSVTRAFALELLSERQASEDGVPVVVPESAGRHGAFPELIRCDTDWHERDCIIARIHEAHDEGRALGDIAVIYRYGYRAKPLEKALREAGIAFVSGRTPQGRHALYGQDDAVKVVSMHSSKGLEFGLVLIPCLGDMPRNGDSEHDEARLLYVAMTRATDRLVMTYCEHSSFTRRIYDSITSVREQLAMANQQTA